jgi:hypothetical protein
VTAHQHVSTHGSRPAGAASMDIRPMILHSSSMPDEPDPPRKVYGFKERAFKRDNALTSAGAPAPTAKDLAMISTADAPRPSRTKDLPKANPKDPNDVYAVLRENRAFEDQAGLSDVEIREIKSRRKRDFWLLLIGGNLAILGVVALSGFNPISAVFGLAGLVVFSLGVTWVMWQVMDKY